MEKVKKGGGENAVKRHTQRNKKMLVTDRLRMLFDDGYYFELSPFAGMGLPYGDIPSAGCLTGRGFSALSVTDVLNACLSLRNLKYPT